MKTGFFYHPIFLQHETTPGHPERADRLKAILQILNNTGLIDQLEKYTPQPASIETLQLNHDADYIKRVKQACEQGTGMIDSPDCSICSATYEAALHAAGAATQAVDAVINGEIKNAFCAVRPPGHHALHDTAMGFCYFNNIAIAARHLQKKHGIQKIMIIDWDVHHGNGTQDSFYDDPSVFFFSCHQYPFYPGSGAENETGSGKGKGYTLNVPLRPGQTDQDMIKIFKQQVETAANHFQPQFILLSAGFDSHHDDPLGGMYITDEGFAQLSAIVRQIAKKHAGGKLVSLLEGGYDLNGLAKSVNAHIADLMQA